jgi:hypothetical protein
MLSQTGRFRAPDESEVVHTTNAVTPSPQSLVLAWRERQQRPQWRTADCFKTKIEPSDLVRRDHHLPSAADACPPAIDA